MNATHSTHTQSFQLEPDHPLRLAALCGSLDEHLRQIEKAFDLRINARGHLFQVIGAELAVNKATSLIKHLFQETQKQASFTPEHIHLLIKEFSTQPQKEQSCDGH